MAKYIVTIAFEAGSDETALVAYQNAVCELKATATPLAPIGLQAAKLHRVDGPANRPSLELIQVQGRS